MNKLDREFETKDATQERRICGEIKPLTAFDRNRNSHNKSGRRYDCKKCRSSKGPKYANRGDDVRKKYGITRPDMGTPCEICGQVPLKDELTLKSSLFMDHCHEKNIPRGFLCSRCNSALGSFGDNLNGIMKVVQYLEALENDGWKEKFKIELSEEDK